MTPLYQQLHFEKAYRTNRLKAAHWVLSHPATFEELLGYAFKNDKEISHKANWVLEFVCLEKIELLVNHLDYFFNNLKKVKADSSVRPLSHICEMLCIQYYKQKEEVFVKKLSEKHKEQLTEVCFDWLITNQKVACEARAMTCLYYLGTEKDWIHRELATIIKQNIHIRSAGYKSRGKATLNKINKG